MVLLELFQDSVMNCVGAGSTSHCRSRQVHAVMLNLLLWLLDICFPLKKENLELYIHAYKIRYQPLLTSLSEKHLLGQHENL